MDAGSARDEALALAVLAKAVRARYEALRCAACRAGVTLDLETMTVHGAKGLEANYVIFVQGRDRKVKDELRERRSSARCNHYCRQGPTDPRKSAGSGTSR